MEEKNNNEYIEELADLDEKGNEKKKPPSTTKNNNYPIKISILIILVLLVIIFIFTKRKRIFLKFSTKEALYFSVSRAIIDCIHQNPNARIGLSTGESLEGIYKYLVYEYKTGEVTFKNVSLFSLEGLCGLKKDNNQSYYYSLNNSLLSEIDVQEDNIHLINEEGNFLLEYQNHAEDYDDLLIDNPIDIQILNLGENGSIGFLDENVNFDLFTHIIKLSPRKRKEIQNNFLSLEKTPIYAITQGIANILKAKEIIVIAIGKDKAKDVRILKNGIFTKKSPITALSNLFGKLTVYCDEEAGSLITS